MAKDRRKLVDDARRRRLVNALVALAHVDGAFNIHSFIDYLHKRDAFTPNQVTTLLWRFDRHGIDHNPRDFKLTIKRGREKAQLAKMSEWQLQRICRACRRASAPIWNAKGSTHRRVAPAGS